MKAIIELDGKRAVLNTEKDEEIAEIRELEGTGRAHDSTRGDVLYLHVTAVGKQKIFYLFSWTRWQGEQHTLQVFTAAEVQNWAVKNFGVLAAEEIARLQELGVCFAETA